MLVKRAIDSLGLGLIKVSLKANKVAGKTAHKIWKYGKVAVPLLSGYMGIENLKYRFTDDHTLNYGPVLVDTKEERTSMEIYEAVAEAILNIEGIENIYDKDISEEEQERLNNEIMRVMSETAKINFKGYIEGNYDWLGVGGMYPNFYNNGVLVTSNRILIDEDALASDYYPKVTKLLIHEIFHALSQFKSNIVTFNFIHSMPEQRYIYSKRLSNDLYCSNL